MIRNRPVVALSLLVVLILVGSVAAPAARARGEDAPPARSVRAIEVSSTTHAVVLHVRADGAIGTVVIFALEDPERLVVDLPGLRDETAKSRIPVRSEIVERIRIGAHSSKTRIVLDGGPAAGGFRERRVTRTRNGLRLELGDGAAADQAATSAAGPVAVVAAPVTVAAAAATTAEIVAVPETSAAGDAVIDPYLDDALAGFDDGESDPELDDALGGFDDDATAGTAAASTAAEPEASRRTYDLTGSVSLGASYNVRPHYATVGPDPNAQNGTYYGNLQRLRLRGDLQLDLYDLPRSWKVRAQGFAFYDFAYLIHGRDDYTRDVLEDYELEYEVLDLWAEGPVLENLDLKLGRQVVNWGRSDTLRVTDVLNPLNNREPLLVDIEDLRLPVTMAKADYYWRNWSFTALIIPEIRYDYNPPPGSDFYPDVSFDDLPPLGLHPNFDSWSPALQAFFLRKMAEARARLEAEGRASFGRDPPSRRAARWGAVPEFAGSITGVYSGWDVSLYVARTYQNRTSTIVNVASFAQPVLEDDDRVTLVGAGGNYTLGSWLFKAEFAFIDELNFSTLVPDWSACTTGELLAGSCVPYRGVMMRNSRLDSMGGIEYYGIRDTNIALEVAYRHLFGYDEILQYLPNYLYENSVDVALRITHDMLNTRLQLTALGLTLLSEAGHLGSAMRLSARYELMDALVLDGGLLYFFEGQSPPFDSWYQNDRLFLKLKHSF